MKKKYRKVGVWTNSPLKNMNKNEVFQFVNKLNNLDISTMIFRETVFDIISFGKANKIHLATTASIERIKHVLSEYNLEIAPDEKDTLKFTVNNDTCYIHSIFKMSYEDFVRKMVATDLTFNSLLMKPDGQIYDMYNGLEDLKNKRLHFVDSFNEKNKTRLVLNCIRYIYKNGFTYDEEVKKYIEECLPSFTKNEKTNALFYLVEYINKEAKNADMELLLNNAFFQSEKTPNVDIGNYEETINSIGKEKYIYLLLILANVNVNKTRFSNLIDADEFNDIKESFALNLSDEMTYYELKDKRGYDYLSNIVILQKEYAKLTKTEYSEPIFHKETVFDLIEQSEKSSTFTDEYILDEDVLKEKIQIPKQDVFGFTSNTTNTSTVNDFDFSSIFSEAEDNSDASEPVDIIETEATMETKSEKEAEVVVEEITNTAESIFEDDESVSTDKLTDSELVKSKNIDEPPFSNDTIIEQDKTPFIDIDALFVGEVDETVEKEELSAIEQDVLEDTSNNEKDTKNTIENSIAEDDDIASILNMSDDRTPTQYTKKRNINPRFKNSSMLETKKDNELKTEEVMPIEENETSESISTKNINTESTAVETPETFPVTPVLFDTPSFASDTTNNSTENTEIILDDMFSSKTIESDQPVSITEEIAIKTEPIVMQEANEEQTREEKKSSLIDDIFEEEVVTPEISLSPEFDTLMHQVAKEGETMYGDQVVQRQTVSETMMTETVPENLGDDETPINFDISEHDLEEILAELNGKKKNSFLDDDSVGADETEDVTMNFANNYSYTPQPVQSYQNTPKTSSEDDDFFKSLNDDFTEIVGGNG